VDKEIDLTNILEINEANETGSASLDCYYQSATTACVSVSLTTSHVNDRYYHGECNSGYRNPSTGYDIAGPGVSIDTVYEITGLSSRTSYTFTFKYGGSGAPDNYVNSVTFTTDYYRLSAVWKLDGTTTYVSSDEYYKSNHSYTEAEALAVATDHAPSGGVLDYYSFTPGITGDLSFITFYYITPDPLQASISTTREYSSTSSITVDLSCTTSGAAGRVFRIGFSCNGQTLTSSQWTGNYTKSYTASLSSLTRGTTYSYSAWLEEKVDGSWISRSSVASCSGSVKVKDCRVYYGKDENLNGAIIWVDGDYSESGFAEYYYSGQSVSVNITNIPSGYKFVQWNKDGSKYTDSTSFTFTTGSSDISYEAIGAADSHTVSITILNDQDKAKGNKTDPTGAGSYSQGASVTVTTDVLKYYTFNGWYIGTSKQSGNLSYTFTMGSSNIDLTAKYTRTSLFNWTNTISSGQPITNLTASDWKAIQDKIDLFYAQDRTWTRAGTGSGQQPRINAAMFNEVRNAIAGITSPSPGTNPLTSQKTANDKVMASYFNGNGSISDDSIKAALNRIISAG